MIQVNTADKSFLVMLFISVLLYSIFVGITSCMSCVASRILLLERAQIKRRVDLQLLPSLQWLALLGLSLGSVEAQYLALA